MMMMVMMKMTLYLSFDEGLCQDNTCLLLPEEEEPGGERDHQQQLLLLDDATNIPEEYWGSGGQEDGKVFFVIIFFLIIPVVCTARPLERRCSPSSTISTCLRSMPGETRRAFVDIFLNKKDLSLLYKNNCLCCSAQTSSSERWSSKEVSIALRSLETSPLWWTSRFDRFLLF